MLEFDYTDCAHCSGRGFLCEAHPTEPFEHDLPDGRICPGPGDPCPVCNPLYGKKRVEVMKDGRLMQ